MIKAIRMLLASAALALGLSAVGAIAAHAEYPCGANSFQASYGTTEEHWGSSHSRVTVGYPYTVYGVSGTIQVITATGQNGHGIGYVLVRGSNGGSQSFPGNSSHTATVYWYSSAHQGAYVAVAMSCA